VSIVGGDVMLLHGVATVDWSAAMNVGVAHSDPNPNSTYFNSKGMWVTYVLVVAFVHYMFLSLPFLSVAMAWTLTNVLHNMVCYFVLSHISFYPTYCEGLLMPDICFAVCSQVYRQHVIYIMFECFNCHVSVCLFHIIWCELHSWY